jgi:hypothetical protein
MMYGHGLKQQETRFPVFNVFGVHEARERKIAGRSTESKNRLRNSHIFNYDRLHTIRERTSERDTQQ